MHFSRTKKSRLPVINMTSLLDVMFLLVIFLLVTMKFEAEGGISVDLPRGKSQEMPKNAIMRLVIMYDGTLFFEREKIQQAELSEKIKATRAGKEKPVLVIQADKDVPWERIVAVTDIAKLAGQARVNFRIKP